MVGAAKAVAVAAPLHDNTGAEPNRIMTADNGLVSNKSDWRPGKVSKIWERYG
jgi:hypothetical protein